MGKRRTIFIVFLVLTAINILLYIFREHFAYHAYATYSSLYAPCDNSCAKKWGQMQNDYPADELVEARKISDSIIGDNKISTEQKILKLAGSLRSHFEKQIGRPSPALVGCTPLMQYKKVSASKDVHLWCVNFAQIFGFFSVSQGIICRGIEIINARDHHVLNECFLPEYNTWAMVDVTNNLLLVSNSNHQLLNLQSFKDSLRQNSRLSFYRVTAGLISESTVDTNTNYIKNYYMIEAPCYYYYRVDNRKVYTLPNKIKRYLSPVSWYEIYDINADKQSFFYLKMFFILLWLISFFVLMISRKKFKK